MLKFPACAAEPHRLAGDQHRHRIPARFCYGLAATAGSTQQRCGINGRIENARRMSGFVSNVEDAIAFSILWLATAVSVVVIGWS